MAKQGTLRATAWWKGALLVAAIFAGVAQEGALAQIGGGAGSTVSVSATPSTVAAGSPTLLVAFVGLPMNSVSYVAFYDGLTQVGQASGSPYQVTYVPTTAGSHSITAVAALTLGSKVASQAVILTVTPGTGGNKPPTVSLSASPTTLNVGSSVTLTATAADSDGTVSSVTFYNGATQLGQVTAAPYVFTYAPPSAGTYNFTAVATDNANASTTSNVAAVTVNAGSLTGNQPPMVSLSASSTTVQIGQATTLTANASDSDGSVTRVEFYDGGTLLATDTASPYTYSFIPSTPGIHTVSATAYDNSGASTHSNPVSITAQSGPVNQPPTVSLSAAPTTIQVGSTSTLTANASDSDGTIAKVEFYNGTTLAATANAAPYTYVFAPANQGTFNFTAKAYDNLNATTTSSVVPITVQAQAQLPRITLSLSNTLFSPGGVVTLTGVATATAPGATISKVSFFMNGAKLVDVTASPYTTTATLTNAGKYTFYATTTDSLGQVQTTLNQVAVAQTAPAVVTTDPDVVRLLNQATFGFSQAEAARVNALGIQGWIADQLTQPVSAYPDARYYKIQLGNSADCTTTMPGGQAYPGDSPQAICARDQLTLAMLQRDLFTNAAYAPDQLRQRVAWALSQILVTSGNDQDLSFAHAMSRYQNLMFQEAFGNYQRLLNKVTYSSQMGYYLTMVNNDRAPPPPSTRVPNENYAREIMQLFSINLVELNQDGTPILDAQNNPVPTYSQADIKEFAKVFTGYTYANSPTQTQANGKQPHYYGAPMVPYPTTANAGHDPNQKNLLNGTVLPAGQTGQQDIDAAVLNVFMHPNTGVYIGKQLIQHLVTGNPSPAYVSRIAGVFNNNGSGVRGDMAAVVQAILLDPEARGPAKAASDFGSLREPVQVLTSLVRALNGLTDGNRFAGAASNLGQNPFFSPTVFNYYMPDNLIPNTMILGPEFDIHTTVTAVGRANLIYQLVYGGYNPDTTIPDSTGTKLFLAPFEAIADNPAAMVSLLNQQMAGGQFPVALEPTIVTAVNAITVSSPPTAAERTNRARMAVYLMASSYDYQVQR